MRDCLKAVYKAVRVASQVFFRWQTVFTSSTILTNCATLSSNFRLQINKVLSPVSNEHVK